MKKMIAFLLSALLLFSSAALAADARSATETARALAPEGYAYLYTEKDGKYFEVHFLNELTNEEYEISVPADETRAIRIESENELAMGSFENTLPEENARLAVTSEYPDAEIDTILTLMDDGLFEVHVYFKTADCFGRFELNAEDATVLKRRIILSAPENEWQLELNDDYYEDVWLADSVVLSEKEEDFDNTDKRENNKQTMISVSRAKAAVTERHPGAKIAEIELDFEGGKYVYEGEAYLNGREYDFEVDAATGSLIKWKLDD
ncbi:MAG: PepSY domain-containing protein [Clostridia bacterium]|nr:PepSY domain-containing protein [Clostridia bacterium]